MSIRTPGRRAGSGAVLRQVKRTMEAKATRSLSASLNLTAMVDFLSVIVIFLLMSFSSSGEIVFNQKDIIPPEGFSTEDLERVPVIAISATDVVLDGGLVESSGTILSESDDFTLPNLTSKLKATRTNFESLQADLGTDKKFDGKILIQADENLPYKLVRRVFVAAAKVGYTNIAYVVRKTQTDPAGP